MDLGLVRAAMLIIAMDDVASARQRMLVMRFMSELSARRRWRVFGGEWKTPLHSADEKNLVTVVIDYIPLVVMVTCVAFFI